MFYEFYVTRCRVKDILNKPSRESLEDGLYDKTPYLSSINSQDLSECYDVTMKDLLKNRYEMTRLIAKISFFLKARLVYDMTECFHSGLVGKRYPDMYNVLKEKTLFLTEHLQ